MRRNTLQSQEICICTFEARSTFEFTYGWNSIVLRVRVRVPVRVCVCVRVCLTFDKFCVAAMYAMPTNR